VDTTAKGLSLNNRVAHRTCDVGNQAEVLFNRLGYSGSSPNLADHVIATLRAHQAELRASGVRHLSLFGSVARGDAEGGSDVDLAVELDPEARIGLFALTALERHLATLLDRPVDLLPEPVENQRLRFAIDRDRLRAF